MSSRYDNHQQYQRYLSTFGRQVLGNLVKILAERNEKNKTQVRRRYNYDKRVLNFGESHILATREPNVIDNESHNNVFDKKLMHTAPQDVGLSLMSSRGLLTLPTGNEMIGGDDASIDMDDAAPNHFGAVLPDVKMPDVKKVKEHVEWDDIFDTQLLEDLYVLDTNSNITTLNENKEQTDYHKNINHLCISKVDSETTKHLNGNNSHHSTADGADKADLKINAVVCNDNKVTSNASKNVLTKKGKLKRASANETTNELKKVKKPTEIPKNTFRKQKYATAVKTWLQNVEPEKIEKSTESPEEWNQVEENIKKTNHEAEKNIKRTVQAQLTNKGGIMKFGKPNHNKLAKESILMDSTAKMTVNNAGSIEVKQKKTKPKFVAPVKSQITVSDIVYDSNIINVNDDSCEEHVTRLSAVKDQEINMILTFSNGICQPNCQYTEDTAVADGVMFEINNTIYCWKNTYKTFCNTMEKLINDNTIVCYAGKNLLKYFIEECDISIVSTEVKVLDLQIGATLLDHSSPPDSLGPQRAVPGGPEGARLLALQRAAYHKLRAALHHHQLWNVFVGIEMPVLPILAEMEAEGVCVDTERLRAMAATLERRLRAAERACHAAAGRAFQVTSALQVRAILYDELQLHVKGDVRVRETLCKGDKSTSEAMLRSLMSVHPLPRLVLEYRHVHKAYSTFVAGIASQVKDGVIKPTWEQLAAVTGRIACSNPNLQAIPRAPFSLLLFPDDTTEEELLQEPNEKLNFRSVYAARAGRVLLAADFRHVECRVFAAATADGALRAALASPDLFRELAANWLGKAAGEVSGADRERTKRLVYASLYGAGARRLADILGVAYDAALAVLASFNRTFPSLKSFGESVVSRCARAGGRLATPGGRARLLPHVHSADPAQRAHAHRQAVNFLIQGTAADLCKAALAAAARRVRAVRAARGARGGARLLLQLHDELVWEVPREDLPHVAAEIKSVMEGIGPSCGVAVPLPVAVSVGPHWGAMEPYPAPPAADPAPASTT